MMQHTTLLFVRCCLALGLLLLHCQTHAAVLLSDIAPQARDTTERGFSDNGADTSGAPALVITGAKGTGFSLTRIALSFDDGDVLRIVKADSPLQANASIGFTGTGLLHGVWEIATPTSTSGKPVYQPLKTVSRYLVGSEPIIVLSPELPTHSSGLYILKLRITQPEIDFELPVLRYSVGITGK